MIERNCQNHFLGYCILADLNCMNNGDSHNDRNEKGKIVSSIHNSKVKISILYI